MLKFLPIMLLSIAQKSPITLANIILSMQANFMILTCLLTFVTNCSSPYIMQALCLMLSNAYYAKTYAGLGIIIDTIGIVRYSIYGIVTFMISLCITTVRLL